VVEGGKPDKLPSLGGVLFEDRELADASLNCGGSQLRVHRAILAARSPVFKSMFVGGMQESLTAVIEIPDVDASAAEAMVEYMYKKKLPSDAPLEQVFVLASKYMVQGLITKVGKAMLEQISSTTAEGYMRVVRSHAAAGSEEASQLWEKLMAKVTKNKALTKAVFESMLDGGSEGAAKRRRTT